MSNRDQTFRLRCPQCGHVQRVTELAELQLLQCAECGAAQRVPPLPIARKLRSGTGLRRRSSGRASRFNLIASAVAVSTIVVCLVGMFILRWQNRVVAESPERGVHHAGDGESSLVTDVPAQLLNSMLNNAAPSVSFCGTYRCGAAQLSAGQQAIFAAPVSATAMPSVLTILRPEEGSEFLLMQYASEDGSVVWRNQFRSTGPPSLHGRMPVSAFASALEILAAYSVDDFTENGVCCSVSSHRIEENRLIMLHACLDKEQAARTDVPLHQRTHLCRVVTVLELQGNVMTVTCRASGPERELTRRYVSMLNARVIDGRGMNSAQMAAFEQAWLQGATLSFTRGESRLP